ncbi:MAG: LamG domain-containing protein, partial [Verrucomicrobiota bacterium]
MKRLILAVVICLVLFHQATAQNRVLELDGQRSFIELPPDVFQSLTQATVEAWVKFNTLDGSRFYSYGGMNSDFCIGRTFRTNRRIQFFINTTASGGKLDLLEVPADIRVGAWCHLAAVCSPEGMRLYYNGLLVATNSMSKSFSSLKSGGTHWIGAMHRIEDAETFNGQLDELRVWRVARTEQEIRQNMHRPLTGTEPHLAAFWNFEDPANPGKDFSPNGIHGTVIGTARVVESTGPGALSLGPAAGANTAASEWPVLDLDGSNGTYVRLPDNIFNELKEITVEGWVRWRSLGFWSRFFDFGEPNSAFTVTQIQST